MQVARIVLQLGIHGFDDDLGFEVRRRKLRNHVLRQEAGTNGAAYRRRIGRLIEEAASAGADFIVFPAFTFVAGVSGLSEGGWTRLALKSKPMVVLGGALAPQSHPPKKGSQEEYLLVVAAGKPVFASPEGHKPYGPVPLILGKRPAIAAISSSVGYVREAPLVFASAAIEATRKAPLLIFDMGHDQYGGRYRKTLTTTVAAMRQIGAKRVFLALSFWRWKNSASKASWALDNEKGAPYHRHEVTDKHSGRVDYLDLFTV